LTLVLAFLESSKSEAPKQDSAINVLVGMYYLVFARHRVGGLSISGVDVIACSWLKVLLEPEKRRMSVDNIHAFIFALPLYGYLYHTEWIENIDTTKKQSTQFINQSKNNSL